MNTPHWAKDWIDQLHRSRARHAERGHDVSRITIGYWDGLLRVCDDTGAYDIRLGKSGNTFHSAVGHPGRALESVFYNRLFNG